MRIFGAPRQYIQGEGVISCLGTIAERRRARPLLIVDQDVNALLESTLAAAFTQPPAWIVFGGQITLAAIDDLTAQARGVA